MSYQLLGEDSTHQSDLRLCGQLDSDVEQRRDGLGQGVRVPPEDLGPRNLDKDPAEELVAKRKEGVDDGDHQSKVVVARIEVVPRQVVEKGLVNQDEDVVLHYGMRIVATVVLPVV